LDDEVVGQVLRLRFAAFLVPEAEQGRLILPHNDPGVRAADEESSLVAHFCPRGRFHVFL
jgi:hypothetical protein